MESSDPPLEQGRRSGRGMYLVGTSLISRGLYSCADRIGQIGRVIGLTLGSIVSTWDFGTVLAVKQLNYQVWAVDTTTGAYILKRKPNLQHIVREKKYWTIFRAHKHQPTAFWTISKMKKMNSIVYTGFLTGKQPQNTWTVLMVKKWVKKLVCYIQVWHRFLNIGSFP